VLGNSGGGSGVLGISNVTGVQGTVFDDPVRFPEESPTSGVSGFATSGTGVRGRSALGAGVEGVSTNNVGVLGKSRDTTSAEENVGGAACGVMGMGGGPGASPGVFGASPWVAVFASGVEPNAAGVLGFGGSGAGGTGVTGVSTGAGVGVDGFSGSGVGVQGGSVDGYAGLFEGKVRITGRLEKAGGGFKIDHPLDPTNKYLNHSFVESPEMKTVYDGVAEFDEAGSAWVELPTWFEELNGALRYQLTAIGTSMPDLHVAEELSGNRFRIAGGAAGAKVCWQITGMRKDRWAATNPIEVEEEKSAAVRGRYLHPGLYDQPEEMGIGFVVRQERARLMEEATGLMETQQRETEGNY
jgi:hypothetical protein